MFFKYLYSFISVLWESLLECRIKLQKALIACNRLPQVDSFHSFKSNISEKDAETIHKTYTVIMGLLQQLLALQVLNFIKIFLLFSISYLNKLGFLVY